MLESISQEKPKELTFLQRVFMHKQSLTEAVKRVCAQREDLVKDVVWTLIALRNERVGYDAHESTTLYPADRDIYLYAKNALDEINPADLDAGINDEGLMAYVRAQLDTILTSEAFMQGVPQFVRQVCR